MLECRLPVLVKVPLMLPLYRLLMKPPFNNKRHNKLLPPQPLPKLPV